jgi:hypothetical protein
MIHILITTQCHLDLMLVFPFSRLFLVLFVLLLHSTTVSATPAHEYQANITRVRV